MDSVQSGVLLTRAQIFRHHFKAFPNTREAIKVVRCIVNVLVSFREHLVAKVTDNFNDEYLVLMNQLILAVSYGLLAFCLRTIGK